METRLHLRNDSWCEEDAFCTSDMDTLNVSLSILSICLCLYFLPVEAQCPRLSPASTKLSLDGVLANISLLPSALFWIPLSALFTVKRRIRLNISEAANHLCVVKKKKKKSTSSCLLVIPLLGIMEMFLTFCQVNKQEPPTETNQKQILTITSHSGPFETNSTLK